MDRQGDPGDGRKKRANATAYGIGAPVKRWFKYSEKDMEAMEHMAKHERFDLALVFLQQSLEKSLKAAWNSDSELRLLYYEDMVRESDGKTINPSETHNLRFLAGKIEIAVEYDKNLFDFLEELKNHYFDRYPDTRDRYGYFIWNGYPWDKYKKKNYEDYLENGHYTQGLIYLKLNKLEELDELLGKMREGERKETLERWRRIRGKNVIPKLSSKKQDETD
jgi:HEPN domain-containing protein